LCYFFDLKKKKGLLGVWFLTVAPFFLKKFIFFGLGSGGGGGNNFVTLFWNVDQIFVTKCDDNGDQFYAKIIGVIYQRPLGNG